jgi:hypothetical protein
VALKDMPIDGSRSLNDQGRRRAFMPPAPTFGEENSGALRAAPIEDIVERSRCDPAVSTTSTEQL